MNKVPIHPHNISISLQFWASHFGVYLSPTRVSGAAVLVDSVWILYAKIVLK